MLHSIISFIQTHDAAIGVLIVAVIDFAIDVNPSLASNSVISAILNFFGVDAAGAVQSLVAKAKAKQNPPAPPKP